ncbi:MAG TPA: Ku protein [Myxococcales bacterium]|nr:Ku protein [Myxococcales bacterium]
MAARSIASATISFGMVSIPIKLYSATQASAGISFHLLHDKCKGRLKQQYVCPTDNEIVPRDHMVKGYEFTKDRYVTFTSEELEALEEKASQAIEITEFLPLEKVDPVYYEKAYYLGPDKGGAKAYHLLAEALQKTGLAAIAKYAARGKGYLVLLRPVGDRLLMQQLYYQDEVRPMADVPVDEAEVKEAELHLAMQLVKQTASKEFHPEAYKDEVRERELALIQKRVEGEEISIAPSAEAPGGQIIDLMEALKASLASKGGAPGAEAPAAEERKPPKRAPKRAAAATPHKAAKK